MRTSGLPLYRPTALPLYRFGAQALRNRPARTRLL